VSSVLVFLGQEKERGADNNSYIVVLRKEGKEGGFTHCPFWRGGRKRRGKIASIHKGGGKKKSGGAFRFRRRLQRGKKGKKREKRGNRRSRPDTALGKNKRRKVKNAVCEDAARETPERKERGGKGKCLYLLYAGVKRKKGGVEKKNSHLSHRALF